MSFRNYLNFSAYSKRLGMLPGLLRSLCADLKAGPDAKKPKQRIYAKYEGAFREIFESRDSEHGLTLTREEVYTLYSGVLAVLDLPGALAEVGVFRGGSAKVLCQLKGEKPLYLCDTFEGMPDEKISQDYDPWYEGTHHETSLDYVKQYLQDYPYVHFVKGTFPESVAQYQHERLEDLAYAFVHLDVDLYHSTLDALKFFYPRMTTGGRIVSHNYNVRSDGLGGNTPGVKTAFMEYFNGKEQQIIEIAETQCLVIKN